MTRGKYAARAARRAAQLDDARTAALQADIEQVRAERDAARHELDLLRREVAAEATRIGAEQAGAEIRRLTDELAQSKAARAADRARFADEVFAVFREDGSQLSFRGFERIAAVFGQTHRVGELVSEPGDSNRHGRRTQGSKLRLLDDLHRQGFRL